MLLRILLLRGCVYVCEKGHVTMQEFPRGDLGIVLYKEGTPVSTYTDCLGATQSSSALTGAYTAHTPNDVGAQNTALPHVGAKGGLSLWVTSSLAGATDIKLKLQSQYRHGEPWADMQTSRQDTGSVSAVQTFTADGTVCVQTGSGFTTGRIRVVALASGVIGAGTAIVVKSRTVP